MAVQIPDPGTGNGQTGDNEYVFRKKVKDNFTDQTNAASRLVGPAAGQIPLSQDTFKAAMSAKATLLLPVTPASSVDDFALGTFYTLNTLTATSDFVNAPFDKYPQIMTIAGYGASIIQIAFSYNGSENAVYVRHKTNAGGFRPWVPMSQTPQTWMSTSASGANVFVDTTGALMRSTSITYTNTNTTKDSNGFIKAASPIVKVHADKVELNGEAEQQNVTYKKNGVGDYTITTVSGLSTDGWYIELPKDMNGNPKVAVTLTEAEGVISLKSYKRIFSMETFTFEPDLDNPLDIPDTRWIDLRLNEIPVEMPDDIQTEV